MYRLNSSLGAKRFLYEPFHAFIKKRNQALDQLHTRERRNRQVRLSRLIHRQQLKNKMADGKILADQQVG